MAVGASGANGLRDLGDLLEILPAKLHAVVLVVLHRPSNHISHLREVLARRSSLPVVIPEENQEFRAGTCYIGEPAAHLSLAKRSRVHLIEGAHDKYRNRTVDLLFTPRRAGSAWFYADRSAMARADWRRSISRVGSPWYLARRMAARGMPSNATEYDGPIDFIGTLGEIAAELGRLVAVSPSEAMRAHLMR